MGLGIPTMTLDHCGMHAVICKKYEVINPIISYTYTQVINNITAKLNEIMLNPQTLKDISDRVLKCAHNYHWDKRKIIWNDIYDQAVRNYQKGINSTSSSNS